MNDSLCTFHLPHLCDCGSIETESSTNNELVQEEFLEVTTPPTPPTPPTTPPEDEELTPAEEKKFGKFLSKFNEANKPKEPTPVTSTSTPVASQTPTLDIAAEVNKALDAREQKRTSTDEIGKLRLEVDALKPKKAKWHHPWTLFSG